MLNYGCHAGLATVEAYNSKTNEWFHIAPMNTRRSSVGVGVVGGKRRQSVYSVYSICQKFSR